MTGPRRNYFQHPRPAGYIGLKGPTDAQKCHSCHTRYWQNPKTRLCRQCEKELDEVTALEIAAAAPRRERAEAIARAKEILAPPRPFAPARYYAVDFWIVWDGSFRYENPSEAAARFAGEKRDD